MIDLFSALLIQGLRQTRGTGPSNAGPLGQARAEQQQPESRPGLWPRGDRPQIKPQVRPDADPGDGLDRG